MNKIILYFVDNYVYIYKNKEIIKVESESIDNGEIIDSKCFITKLKKEKILNTFLNKKIIIILNTKITEKEILYYKNIFEDLLFVNIDIISSSYLIENNTLIEYLNTYVLYTNNTFYNIDKSLLNNYIEAYNIKSIKVLSNNQNIKNINCKVYYYKNINTFIINKYNLI